MSATIVGGTSGVALEVDAVPKAARAIIYDKFGNEVETATINDEHHLQVASSQYVYEFAGNTSTANLGSGAAFTGTAESTLGTAAIQIMFYADQPCTIQLQQSVNGSNWDFVSTYFTAAGFSDCRTLVAKGSYLRVVVTNTGAGATTQLRLQTVAVPVSTPLTSADGVAVDWVQKPTYRAAFTGAAVVGASLTIKGSASKLVCVTRMGWSSSSSNGSVANITIQKLSNVTGGTAAAVAAVPLDSKFPAATAAVQSWASGAPTITALGSVYAARYQVVQESASTPINHQDMEFGAIPGVTPVRLRGVSEWLAIMFSAVGANNASDLWVGWTEE